MPRRTTDGHCLKHEILPYISNGRHTHNQTLKERFTDPGPLPEGADAVTKMKHRLKTTDNRTLYAKRKSTVEPVFGIIEAVMGCRQLLLRSVASVRGGWDLVCMAWNLKVACPGSIMSPQNLNFRGKTVKQLPTKAQKSKLRVFLTSTDPIVGKDPLSMGKSDRLLGFQKE